MESEVEIKFRQHYFREEKEQEKRETERRVGKEGAAGSSTDYTVPHSMVRDKERVGTWKMVFHKSEAIEHHYPKFWEDVQTAASEITMKGKGWQREEGYKGGYKGQNQYKGGYKEQDKGGHKGKNQFQKDGKGKGKQYPHRQHLQNPQNPFVASAQASEADQGGKGSSQADQQAGPPYFFRGWAPALQAAAPAAAVAAAASASADVRVIDAAQKGGQKGAGFRQEGQIPVTPRKRVGWHDQAHANRAAKQQREWEEWGRDQGPRPLRLGGPQGSFT